MEEKQKEYYAIQRNGKPCYKNNDLQKVLDKFKSPQMCTARISIIFVLSNESHILMKEFNSEILPVEEVKAKAQALTHSVSRTAKK